MLSRLPILSSVFGAFRADPTSPDYAQQKGYTRAAREAAQGMGKRWSRASARDPELRKDLIALGGLLMLPPVHNVNGHPEPVSQSEYLCGREAGRRELATQLLALMGLTIDDFNQLMEDDHED